MKLVFATNNNNKIKEISHLTGEKIILISLSDINCFEEIPETQSTIEGNASQKAFHIYEKYHYNCFADDTGLEIDALQGRPGVLSARYAGESKNAEDNMNKILAEMHGITNRNARFKTVISLVIDGKEVQFEGVVNGMILAEKRGDNGFGYDPIFAPDQTPLSFFQGEGQGERSFAEMELSEKNKISHRAIAVHKLVNCLNSLYHNK